jgi:glycosyltransferase involved in cell wall biosynthesis
VLVLPDWRAGNPYLELIERAVCEAAPGTEFRYRDFDSGVLSLLLAWLRSGCAGVVHLHWLDPWIAPVLWARSPRVAGWRAALLVAQVRVLRLLGARVVLTLHNLHSHESADPAREVLVLSRLAAAASTVLAHSDGAARRICQTYPHMHRGRVTVVPHPNYDGCYAPPQQVMTALPVEAGPRLNVLYFGHIRPYKGVEQAVAAVQGLRRPDVRLTVAGRVADPSLAAQLEQAAAADDRIVLELGAVEDERVFPLFAAADVVIVPFRRTLSSGSIVLALTLGRPVITTPEAQVLDLLDASNGFLCQPEAISTLLEGLDRAALEPMRRAARRTADGLSPSCIGTLLLDAYRPGRAGADRAGNR